ncbi:MAG: serine/threonine protein kinase [Labilithrix sp.]|nr:serine/threonine protein kinase [Labilithrix sp.]
MLGDRYEVLDVVGRGGQSTVYRARDRIDGDEVAIKVVHGAVGDPDAMERTFREAQSMSQLLGTSAVRILHQVRTPEGALGLVMELLEGRDLEAHLTELEARGERAAPSWIEHTFGPIVSTLQAAHSRGLVHRDLKAENVYLVSEARGGGVRLLDFGFVKLLRAPSITNQEMVAGSPSYIAPETWLNGAAHADERADVYSLAVMLYRAIAGRLPFRGETVVELMINVTSGPREKLSEELPGFSPDIDAWVEQALAIERDQRFSSANGVFRALCACFPGR